MHQIIDNDKVSLDLFQIPNFKLLTAALGPWFLTMATYCDRKAMYCVWDIVGALGTTLFVLGANHCDA